MTYEHQARDPAGPELGQARGKGRQESASCASENLELCQKKKKKKSQLTDSQPLLTLQGELVEKWTGNREGTKTQKG